MSTVRHAAAWTYRVLIALFAAAVIVEVLAAGVGVFGAMPGEDKPVSHGAFGDKFAVHAAIGGFLVGCSLLLLIAILIAQARPLQTGATSGAGGPDVRQGRRWTARERTRRTPARSMQSMPFWPVGTDARCVGAGPGTERAGPLRRFRP